MLKVKLKVSQIAEVIGAPAPADRLIQVICGGDEIGDHACYFLAKKPDPERMAALERVRESVFVVAENLGIEGIGNSNLILKHSNPRLAMAHVLDFVDKQDLLAEEKLDLGISKSAKISPLAHVDERVSIADGVVIEAFCFIGPNTVIGTGSVIKTGAKISRNARIGRNVMIRENSVVGGNGFGIVQNDDGTNFRIPHLGGVIIGDHVEIGALNTVCSGTLAPTVVEDYVKTDDHVHIAHNVKVGRNTIITAGVMFCGSVRCDEDVWLGVNSTIFQGKRIGKKSVIGIGSVVTKDVEAGMTIAGNPAKDIKEFVKINKAIGALVRNAEAQSGQ